MIVVTPDSFKESMSAEDTCAEDTCAAMTRGARRVWPEAKRAGFGRLARCWCPPRVAGGEGG